MLTIGAPLEHSLDEPIGLLSDCHRRIERFLDTLIRVTEVIGSEPLTDEARDALKTSLKYFREAAPTHTLDEEDSLFPRLRVAAQEGTEAGAKAQQALDIVDGLQADHIAADKRHAEIDKIGQRWLQDGSLPADQVQQLQSELRDLRAFYDAHIGVEDNQLFPISEELLDEKELSAMGREMAARRK